MKQKRQTGAGGMVQASNISSTQLTSHSTKWMNPNKELRGNFNMLCKNGYNRMYTSQLKILFPIGYDGPLQFNMSQTSPELSSFTENKDLETRINGMLIF